MATTANGMGIIMEGCLKENMQSFNSAESLRSALKSMESQNLKIVIIIMPARDAAVYRESK